MWGGSFYAPKRLIGLMDPLIQADAHHQYRNQNVLRNGNSQYPGDWPITAKPSSHADGGRRPTNLLESQASPTRIAIIYGNRKRDGWWRQRVHR